LTAVAAQHVSASDVVLCEAALLTLPRGFSCAHVAALLRDGGDGVARALQLFHPLDDSGDAWRPLRAIWRGSGSEFVTGDMDDAERCALQRLHAVVTLNAFGGGDAEPRAHVFENASRLNHACNPACCRTVGCDGRIIARANISMNPGEECTISYLVPHALLQPSEERRAALAQYGFDCDCSRCVGEDDTRGFACGCGRGSVFLPARPAPEARSRCARSRCSSCGTAMSASAAARLVAAEARCGALLEAAGAELGALAAVLHECEAAGMCDHYLQARAMDALAEAHSRAGQFGAASDRLAALCRLTRRTLPQQPLPLGFTLERLGDAMAECRTASAAGTATAPFSGPPSADQVAAAYGAALGQLRRVYEPQRPYVREAESKMASVV